jgi:hypothetical protein
MMPAKAHRQAIALVERLGAVPIELRPAGKHVALVYEARGRRHTVGLPHRPRSEACWRQRVENHVKQAMRGAGHG